MDIIKDKSIKYLEREKEALITRYMELQDKVDEYNEQIFVLCCEIEKLNQMIIYAKGGDNNYNKV